MKSFYLIGLSLFLLFHISLAKDRVRQKNNGTNEDYDSVRKGQRGKGKSSSSRPSGNDFASEIEDELEKKERASQQYDAERAAAAKAKKRYRDGLLAAKSTIRAASDENCDWRTNALSLIKGEVCGKYYKVLEIDKSADRSSIRKAYRAKSLDVHPDKNPTSAAEPAFKLLNEAYECLSDEECKRKYDSNLIEAELQILSWRQQQLQIIKEYALEATVQVHHYLTMASKIYINISTKLWALAGNLVVSEIPVGRGLLLLIMVIKGRRFLLLQSLAYALLRFNSEIGIF